MDDDKLTKELGDRRETSDGFGKAADIIGRVFYYLFNGFVAGALVYLFITSQRCDRLTDRVADVEADLLRVKLENSKLTTFYQNVMTILEKAASADNSKLSNTTNPHREKREVIGRTGIDISSLLRGRDGHDGAPGPRGPPGHPGPPGQPGTPGAQGPSGHTGAPGHPGAQGLPGPSGKEGKHGVAGRDAYNLGAVTHYINSTISRLATEVRAKMLNEKPCQCLKGDPGLDGRSGTNGQPGPAGLPGRKGAPGSKGEKGIKGDSGNRGANGEKGERGLSGVAGLKGNMGPIGQNGTDGMPGVAGRPGLKGAPGSKGEQGLKGDPGKIGLPGNMGVKGEKGERGISGIPGLKGDMGPMGHNGTDGMPGVEGPPGLKGEPGNKGEQGVRVSNNGLVMEPNRTVERVTTTSQTASATTSVNLSTTTSANLPTTSTPLNTTNENSTINIPTAVVNGAVRLDGSRNVTEDSTLSGVVEAFYNGRWGYVCDDHFGTTSGIVVCRNLGMKFLSVKWSRPVPTADFIMDDVKCSGTESYLTECSFITNHDCGVNEGIFVSCQL